MVFRLLVLCEAFIYLFKHYAPVVVLTFLFDNAGQKAGDPQLDAASQHRGLKLLLLS